MGERRRTTTLALALFALVARTTVIAGTAGAEDPLSPPRATNQPVPVVAAVLAAPWGPPSPAWATTTAEAGATAMPTVTPVPTDPLSIDPASTGSDRAGAGTDDHHHDDLEQAGQSVPPTPPSPATVSDPSPIEIGRAHV